MSYVTETDSPNAQELELRWWSCSARAREFAAQYGGRWAPMLPHVIAEEFDRSEADAMRMMREAILGVSR